MKYDDFLNKWLGKSIDFDGMYGPQCVDLVAQYCVENNKPVAYANAKDWANNPALRPAFDWIDNNPNDPNQLPKRGDIVVFSGMQPGSGGFGHIDIFDMATGTHSWQGLDQNWGGQYVHFVPNHIWTYVLGWWTVKDTPAPMPAPDVHPDPAPTPPPTPVETVPAPTPETTPTTAPEPAPAPTPTPEPVVTPVEPVPVDTPVVTFKPVVKQNWLQKFIEAFIKWLKS